MDNLQGLCDKLDLLRETAQIVACLKSDPECFKLLKITSRKVESLCENAETLKCLLDEHKVLYEETKVQEKLIKHVMSSVAQLENTAKTPLIQHNMANGHNYDNTLNDHTKVQYLKVVSAPKPITYEELSPINSPLLPVISKLQPKCLIYDMCLLEHEEFKALPKYMVGRLTLDEVNAFINVINEVITKKYNILSKRQSQLKTYEMPLYNKYKKQQDILKMKGKQFLTEEDIARESEKAVLEKKAYTYLTILRHAKKLLRLNINAVSVYIIQK